MGVQAPANAHKRRYEHGGLSLLPLHQHALQHKPTSAGSPSSRGEHAQQQQRSCA